MDRQPKDHTERRMPDWMDGFMEYTDPLEPCPLYFRWTAIATLSSVLERKCWLPHGVDKTFYPNFYIALVGPSGARKTTALEVGQRALEEIGMTVGRQSWTTPIMLKMMNKSYEALKEAGKKGPYLHSSLSLFAGELAVFLKPHKVDVKWFDMLCDLYDCGSTFEYYTMTSDIILCKNIYLTIFGGMTPDGVAKAIPRSVVGEGFTSRMIFAWSNTWGMDKDPDSYDTSERRSLWDDLLDDLRIIRSMSGPFCQGESFKALYQPWYERIRKEPKLPGREFKGYNSRRQVHLLKLAIISCASRRDGRMTLNDRDFRRALSILEEVECQMPRAVGYITTDQFARVQQEVMELMCQAKDKRMTLSQIYRQVHGDVSLKDLKDRVMWSLREIHFITCENPGARHGHEELIYVVNPAFYKSFYRPIIGKKGA